MISFKYKIIVGVGVFKEWVTKIPEVDVYITQWYGPGVDKFQIKMHYIPHGYNRK